MTIVVPASADFAAYALQNLKVVHHVGSKEYVRKTQKDADRNMRRAAGSTDADEPGLVPAAPISIDVSISDREPQQQATYQQAAAAYRALDD